MTLEQINAAMDAILDAQGNTLNHDLHRVWLHLYEMRERGGE